MSLSGHLEEVPLSEVLAAVEGRRRSGVLRLARGVERARVEFREGVAVRARAPGLARLGDVLVARGLADPITVREAARIQAEERGRRLLGQILLSNGVLDERNLGEVLAGQIQLALDELATWTSGRFEFISDEPRLSDPIFVDPEKLAPPSLTPIHFGTSETAETLPRGEEAPREDDADTRDLTLQPEIGRVSFGVDTTRPQSLAEVAGGTDPDREAEPAEMGTAEMGAGLPLEVVSPDDALFELLKEVIPPSLARSIRVSVDTVIRRPAQQHCRAFLVLDLRRSAVAPEDISTIKRRRPGVAVLAVVDARADIRRAYQAGAAAVVPPEPEVIGAALKTLTELLTPPSPPPPSLSDSLLFRSYREPGLSSGVGEAPLPVLSATVALELMRAVSEFAERAVLFLVGRENLTVAGAFGFGVGGRSLAELTQGLSLELGHAGGLAQSIHSRQAQALDFHADGLPEPLRHLLGTPPLTGEGVALPVPGQEGVIAVIYTDNDQIDREIEDLEILELAAHQVGPQLETELLISQASRSLS